MSLPDYLYAEIFDHLDFHALIRLRRAVPEFSDVVDPLLKRMIAQICVDNLKTSIELKKDWGGDKILYFATQWRLLKMFDGMAGLRYSA